MPDIKITVIRDLLLPCIAGLDAALQQQGRDIALDLRVVNDGLSLVIEGPVGEESIVIASRGEIDSGECRSTLSDRMIKALKASAIYNA